MDLVLNSRKGFIKIALTQGASLVPVLGFGENDIFDRVDNPNFSILHKLAKLAKMAAPLFSGRYVILPHKVPLVTVGKQWLISSRRTHPCRENGEPFAKRNRRFA